MASDQQVALTRTHRGSATHLPRSARQVVPAFLQKLYEMLNDSANDALIRWSDTGDSFFVLDQERFAREVLGRWFKHQNFSSFVRQLNMYGFRKIPHLQQGVLRSESETEFWNFEHPSFRRGQPDLLCLIQRKKQAAERGDDVLELRDVPQIPVTAPTPGNLSAGQILDINSIVNGIAAIKRHQTTISAELNTLKDSNQHLWQEAIASRERHKKHQDTINRILKFLAGVFGHSSTAGGPVHHAKEDIAHEESRAVVPRKLARLLITDADRGVNGKGVGIMDVVDEDANIVQPELHLERSPSPPSRFLNVDTPIIPSTPLSDAVSPPAVIDPSNYHTALDPSHSPHVAPSSSTPAFSSNATAAQSTSDQTSSVLTTTTTPPPHSSDPAALLQSTFSQVLNTPGQLQRLLAALGSAQSQPAFPIPDPQPPPPPPPHPQPLNANGQLMAFDPQLQYGFPHGFTSDVDSHPLLSSTADDTSIAHIDALADNAERIHSDYRDAEEIEKDVDALHTSINSLIESLGLDPTLLSSGSPATNDPAAHDGIGSGDQAMNLSSAIDDANIVGDLDFDSFWSQISPDGHENTYQDLTDRLNNDVTAAADVSQLPPAKEQFTAFLDEVNSQSDGTASPTTTFRQVSPEINRSPTTTKSKKRKSDTAELNDPGEHMKSTKTKPTTNVSGRGKRKR